MVDIIRPFLFSKLKLKHACGLEMMAPRAMRQHAVRRALSCAAREADFDEHRADARNFGCVGHDGREYYPYAP